MAVVGFLAFIEMLIYSSIQAVDQSFLASSAAGDIHYWPTTSSYCDRAYFAPIQIGLSDIQRVISPNRINHRLSVSLEPEVFHRDYWIASAQVVPH